MSTDKLTRCPHCKAAFKVTESQLAVANGRVRCGACMNVFDALAYSLGDAKDISSEQAAELDQAQDETAFHEELSKFSDQEDTTADLSDELIQDNPEQDAEGDSYQEKSPFGDELSTSFMELDNQDSGDNQFANEVDVRDETPDDESWAREMLEEEKRADQTRIEPHIEAESFEEPEVETPIEPDPFQASPSAAPIFESTEESGEHISFYYDDQEESPKRSPWVTAGLVAFNGLLIIVLIAIASWFHYEKLAKYPALASIYQSACDAIGCKLPKLSDLTKIRSHNLVVRSHPTTKNALIIDAVIINEADYAQDFPDLALYFSDINNKTVAQKLIKPPQYLSAEILEWQQLPSQQPVHISLEIVDPGKEAVNYALKFYLPKTEQNPS